jgi:hypothetical protein
MVSAQKDSLPLQVQQCVDDLLEHVARIEANIAEYDPDFCPAWPKQIIAVKG